jgi:hypothetical protein
LRGKKTQQKKVNKKNSHLSENELNKLDELIADMPSPDPEEAVQSFNEPPVVAEAELMIEELTPLPFPDQAVKNETVEEPIIEPVQAVPAELEAITPPPLPEEFFKPEAVEQPVESDTSTPEEALNEPVGMAKVTAPLPPLPQDRKLEETFPDFNFKLPWEEDSIAKPNVEESSFLAGPPLCQ